MVFRNNLKQSLRLLNYVVGSVDVFFENLLLLIGFCLFANE